MKDAQAFGTKLHGIAETLAWHRSVLPSGNNEHMRPFGEAVQKFLDLHVSEVLATELSVASEEQGFGGTMDLYCQLHDGSYAIVDWKTSKNGLTREHGLQTAAYALLLREQGYTVNKRFTVRIKQERPGEFHARSYTDHAGDVEAFRACSTLWHWLNRNKLLKAMEMAS